MSILNLVDGYKTYIAAAGLIGLSVYQFSTGDIQAGIQSFFAALAAGGLRHAITKTS